jgi:hypothetical protein
MIKSGFKKGKRIWLPSNAIASAEMRTAGAKTSIG